MLKIYSLYFIWNSPSLFFEYQQKEQIYDLMGRGKKKGEENSYEKSRKSHVVSELVAHNDDINVLSGT